MNGIKVYLIEEYEDLDGGFAFKVDEMELHTLDDISQRRKSIYNYVAVEDEFGEEFYVHKDILDSIIDRLVD